MSLVATMGLLLDQYEHIFANIVETQAINFSKKILKLISYRANPFSLFLQGVSNLSIQKNCHTCKTKANSQKMRIFHMPNYLTMEY